MELRDLITEIEYSTMEAWRDHTLSQTRGNLENKIPMREILHVWEKSKQNLGKMFQNHLILSKPFSVQKTSAMMIDTLRNAIRDSAPAQEFWTTFNWLVLEASNMRLDDNYEFIRTEHIHHLTSLHVIYDGRLDGDVSVFICNHNYRKVPSQKVVKINKTTRIMKAIHLFYTEMEKFFKKYPNRWPSYLSQAQLTETFEKLNRNYEDFRIVCSQATNQRKLEGLLCLSIHPLDFMTMSDNANGWNSCMRWDNGCGDYCIGTVEMMNSPYVCMAYLINEDKTFNFEGGNWNSKAWRELYIVHPEVITNVKAYPYRNDELTRAVVEWLRDLAIKNLHYDYQSKNIIWDDYSFYNTEGEELPITYVYFNTGYMYNDFCYHHIMYPHKDWEPEDGFDIYYSGDAQCMICGDLIDSDNSDFDESHLFCDECDGHIVGYCVNCGEKLYEDEEYLTLSTGEIVCGACQEDCAVDTWNTIKYDVEYSKDVLNLKTELRRIGIVLPVNNTELRTVGYTYINLDVTEKEFCDVVLTNKAGFLGSTVPYPLTWSVNALYVKDKIITMIHQKAINTIFTDDYPLFYPRWSYTSMKYHRVNTCLDVPEDMTVDQYLDNIMRYYQLEETPYNKNNIANSETVKENIRKNYFSNIL